MTDVLIQKDIFSELWREYEFVVQPGVTDWPATRVYRIYRPVLLYTRPGGTTHRVVSSDGVAHCVPAPGYNGCVLRWYCGAGKDPVQF